MDNAGVDAQTMGCTRSGTYLVQIIERFSCCHIAFFSGVAIIAVFFFSNLAFIFYVISTLLLLFWQSARRDNPKVRKRNDFFI